VKIHANSKRIESGAGQDRPPHPAILQEDGRIVDEGPGRAGGLSLTPCIERVKRMERDGVIAGYHARVDPQALGARSWCSSRSRCCRNRKRPSSASAAPCCGIPEVMECHLVSGDFDYLIKARIHEMSEYRKLLGEICCSCPARRSRRVMW
jgi:Lrp/AsnC family leucine-responsive transcriptional regulator